MKETLYKFREFMRENKLFDIISVIIGFMFVIAALIVYDKLTFLEFWVAILLFGGGSVFTLHGMLQAKKTLEKTAAANAGYLRKIQENTGYFIYDTDGFVLTLHNGKPHQRWVDIESVFAHTITYWDDRSAITETSLDAFTIDRTHVFLTESSPGWHQFVKRLSENIPITNKNWKSDADASAKRVLLFDKKGRTLERAEADWYSTPE